MLGAVIKGIGEDAAGELYLLADGSSVGGQVLKLVPIPATPALLNLSTRGKVQTGDRVLIAGFILTGSASKNVVIRARGPSLSANGRALAGRLSNPVLTLQASNGQTLDANDDWMTHAQRQELIDVGLALSDPAESAVIARLSPGSYTAAMRGVGGTTGIGLIELYDVERTAPANAVNLSTRGLVQTGDNVLIGGLIVRGMTTERVIVRAIGPSLTGRGVSGALQNPTLELVNAFGTRVAFNDNWGSDQAADIIDSGVPPQNDAESAIIRTVNPGNYTALVRGAGDTTGIGLVEIYRLNP